jgi:hypothetical protein
VKQTSLLLLVIATLLTAISIGASRQAHAAKLYVVWTAPTQNTDSSPLTDLAGYRIEWGSCTAAGVFNTYQAGENVGLVTRAAIYPTNLYPVCVRIYAINSKQVLSSPAYTSSAITPPTLSKPTH